jgi:membrane-associated phospholipid phosphatase
VTSGFIKVRWQGRRIAEWLVILGALTYSLLFVYFDWGGAAAYVLALLPIVLAYIVTRTWLAAAFMFLLPMYFVIGQLTAGWQHYTPYIALDHAMALRAEWMLVYGSLYMCGFLLPLLVVRGRELLRQSLKAYLFVMVVSYAGFFLYPTIAPRNENVVVHDFASWSLKVFYDIDQPYGCFPSLHVAYSFVAALSCYRMHRGVGLAACAWAAIIGVSTVYTKQHFVVDAIAGAFAGVIAYAIFLRGRPREAVREIDMQLAPRRALFAVAAYGFAIAMFWVAYQAGLSPGE